MFQMFPTYHQPVSQGCTICHYQYGLCCSLCSQIQVVSDTWHQSVKLTNIIFQIWALSLHRQYFSDVLRTLHLKDLQLLQDMDVCWSSTLLMVEHAILLHHISLLFCTSLWLLKLILWIRPFKPFWLPMKWASYVNINLEQASGMCWSLSRRFYR